MDCYEVMEQRHKLFRQGRVKPMGIRLAEPKTRTYEKQFDHQEDVLIALIEEEDYNLCQLENRR